MTGPETQTADQSTDEHAGDHTGDALVEDALVEEVSIDGMCGVY